MINIFPLNKRGVSARMKAIFIFSVIGLCGLMFLMTTPSVHAATITSTATGGLWSSGSTWVGGVVPATTDTAVIATTGGNSVSIGANATIANVTVNSGATLTFGGAFTLTVNGTVAVDGTVNGSTGIIKTNKNPSVIDGVGTINSLITIQQPTSVASTSNITVTGVITLANTLTITSGGILNATQISSNGKTVANNGTVNLGSYVRIGGTAVWTQGTNAVVNITGAFTPTANITLNASASGNIVNYNGTSPQTADIATYYIFKANNTSGVTLSGASTITTLTIGDQTTNSLFSDGGFAITPGTGSVLNLTSGTYQLGSASAATTWPAWGTRNISAGTTVNYASGAASQAVSTVPSYSNLLLSGLSKTISSGTLTVGGDLTINSGATYLGSTNNPALNLSGNFSNSGTFTQGTGLLTLNGTSSQDIGGASVTAFNNVTIANTSVPVTVSTNFSIASARVLTINLGAVLSPLPSVVVSGAGTLTGSGTVQVTRTVATADFNSQYTITNRTLVNLTVAYVGTSSQTVSALTYGGLTIANSNGVTLGGNAVVGGVFTLTNGTVTTGANDVYISSTGSVSRTSGWIFGNLRKYITTGATVKTFEVGDASNYAPVNISFGNITVAGDVTWSTTAGDDPNIGSSLFVSTSTVNRYWTGTNSATSPVSFNNYSATFNFLSGDLDSGVDTSQLSAGEYSGGIWIYPNVVSALATSTQASGITGFGDFQLGIKQNPVPTTTSISPTSATAGGPSFTLTVNGTNFISSSTIQWNGASRSTTFASSTQLTATILASDIASAGTSTVTVISPGPGGGTSNGQSFTVNNPTPSISSITPTSTPIGGTDFTLTVNGSGFVSGSTVQWNGNARATTYVSGSQLTATILASDIASAGTSTVTVFNSAPGGGTSNSAIFTAIETASKFVVTSTATSTAGVPFVATIEAQKTDNSVDINYQNDVTLVTSGSATGGGLVNIVNGVGTSTITDTVAETVTLSLTDSQSTGLNVSSTANVTVSPGPVTTFTINNPGSMDAKIRAALSVGRKDQYSNLVTSGTNTVYLYSTSTSTQKAFYDAATAGNTITSIPINPGSSSVSVWYYDDTAGTYTLTASDNATSPDGAAGIADATTTVTVLPVATKFVIIPFATSTAVGSNLTIAIQAQKPDGSVDTNYQNDVTLVTNGSATGGGLVNIVNGSGSLQISDTVAETVHLSLSDTQSTGLDVSSVADIEFVAGAPSQFALSHPGTITAGTRAAYVVTQKDSGGNLSTNATTTVYLYSNSTGSGKAFYADGTSTSTITSVVIPMGTSTASFYYYDNKAGSWTITASDSASAPNGATGIADASDSLTVSAASTSAFTLDNPGATMTVGTRVGYNVGRIDQFGNSVSSGTDTAYLFSTSLATTTAFYNAAADGNTITAVSIGTGSSTAAFWYYDDSIGTWTISASDSASAPDGATGIADATTTITVTMAPVTPTRFMIYAASSTTAGSTVVVTIKAEDNSGNVDTTYQQDVTLNTSGSATVGGLVDIVNGVGTINITDTVAETVHLSLTDSQSTGLNVSDTHDIVFSPGAVYRFVLSHPGTLIAGNRAGYNVYRKDQYGNAVTSGLTTAYLYTGSSATLKGFYDASSGGNLIVSITIPDSASSTAFWYYDTKSATTTVTATDNATAPDGTAGITDAVDAITIVPAATAKFVINNPGDMTAGTRLGYTVSRQDQFSNDTSSGSATVYLYTNSTATSTKFYNAATGGSVITSLPIASGASSGSFWYYNQVPGTYTVTVSDNPSAPDGNLGIADDADSVNVLSVPIVATKLVISGTTSSVAGSSVAIGIQAQDNSGNIDTTFNGGVTLNVSGSATGGGLATLSSGVATVVINDATAETVVLSLSDTQSTGLDVSSTHSIVFSTPIIITASGGGGTVYISSPSTSVGFSGSAFPGGHLTIMTLGRGQIPISQGLVNSPSGNFSIDFSGALPGFNLFGLVVTDKDQRTTQTKIYSASTTSATIDVRNVILPPTVGILRSPITKGDFLVLQGYAKPYAPIEVMLDGKMLDQKTNTDANGFYEFRYNTAALTPGDHNVKVRMVNVDGSRSDFSLLKTFSVSTVFVPATDLNGDGIVDARDVSIFVSLWFSKDAQARQKIDFNHDGTVDVKDLSIFAQSIGQ